MRGKGITVVVDGGRAGITPAYAGKSRSVSRTPTVVRDHPRVCGEKKLMALVLRAVLGSPPHMRGKAQEWMKEGKAERITPAYAGKRNAQRLGASGSRDHPRVCGEK